MNENSGRFNCTEDLLLKLVKVKHRKTISLVISVLFILSHEFALVNLDLKY